MQGQTPGSDTHVVSRAGGPDGGNRASFGGRMNHQQTGSQGMQGLAADAALRAVVERVSGSSGGEFYRRLAAELGHVFRASYAGVGELSLDGERVSLLGAWSRDPTSTPGDFAVAATPAEPVAQGEIRLHRERVRREFPADQRLQRLFAESYLGVPITDGRGDVLGLIELIADTPVRDADAATAIVMAMAERTATEMERDQAEAALRDSEMRYRALIEDSFHLVAEVVDERFIYASSGYTDTLGYPPEDLLGGSVFELIHEEDRKAAAGELRAMLSQRRAAHFTVRMRHEQGAWRWIECTARAFRTSGGEFRTTLFSRDVTDRVKAEAALRESEELFRSLIKDLRVGVALHDADARVLVCNDAALALLGLTEEEVLGKTSYDDSWRPTREDGTIIPPNERPVPLAIATGAPVRDIVYGVHRPATGEQAWVLASAEPQFDADGRVHRVICSLNDITARLMAEQELRASEGRFRFLAENSMDVISRYDADGRCVWMSPSVTPLTGYTPEEVVGHSLAEIFANNDDGLLAGALANVQEGIESFRTTFQVRHKDGHQVWMEATNKVVRDPETADVIEIQTSARDISGRKRAEDELRESEARFRLLAENSTDIIARYTPGGRCIWVSPSIRSVTGRDPEAVIGQIPGHQIHPDDREGAVEAMRALAAGEDQRTYTFRFQHVDGHYIWLEAHARAIRDAGGALTEVQTSSRDVTARMNAEDELRESETRFRLLAENATDMISRFALDGTRLWVSPSVQAITGYSQEETMQSGPVDNVHPDDVAALQTSFRAMVDGEASRRTTFRFRHRDGRYLWLEADGRAIRDEDGRVIEIQSSARDVTARKQAEEELRESEGRFRLLAHNSTDIIGRFSPDGRCVWISPSAQPITGYTPEEIVAAAPAKFVHPDDALEVWNAFNGMVESGATQRATFRFRHKDGHYIWLEANGRAVRDDTGQVVEIHSATRDVTARMEAEDDLRESEGRFRLLAENATDMIGRFTPDGVCLWVSPSVTAVMGYEPAELIGQNLREGIHPDDLAAISRGPDWERPDSVTSLMRYRHKAGHYIWIESTSNAVRNPQTGEVIEIHNTSRDVTARKAAEDDLRESEARFRLLAENATDVIGRYAMDGRCLWVSPSVTQVLGYAPDEIVGQEPFGHIHRDDLQDNMPFRPGATDLPDQWRTTLRYRHKDGRWVWLESTNRPARDPQTGAMLEVHSTSRDVTARIEAEEQLRASESRYRSLSESSPLGVYETTADGDATYFNERAIRMAGIGLDELKGWGWSRHVHPDDRPIVEAAWRAATQDGRECTIEYRLQTPRGIIWVSSHALPIRLPDGTVEKYVGTIDNITERREAQEAVRRSEQLFRATLESTADGIIVTRPLGELMYWNNRAAEMLAIPQTVLDTHSVQAFGRYIIENAREPEALVMAFSSLPSDEPVQAGTWTARDGRMFEAFAHPLHDPSGDLLRVWSIREVTEKHQSEMALRQSEDRFRSLAEHTTDLVLGICGPGVIDYASPNWSSAMGYNPEVMIGRNALDFVHPDDLPYTLEEFERAAEGDRAVCTMLRARHGQTGEWRWCELTANFYTSDMGEQRAVVTARDVTSRKQAEDALRESEERLRTVVNSVPLVLVAVDRDETVVLAEGQGLGLLGTPTRPLVGRSIAEELENHPQVLADMRRALAGDEVSTTTVFGRIVFEAHFRPIFDEHGQPNGMIGVAYDISARVEAERMLRDSEETARALLNAPTDGAVLVDREGTILAMNETAERRFREHASKQGVGPRDFIGTCVFDIFPPDLRAQRRARNDEVFRNGQRRHFEDERDGIWTDVTVDPIRDADGNIVRLAIFSRDVTDRKRDEAALRKRSRELEALNDYLEKTSAELERSQDELREASEQLAELLDAEQARSKTDTLTGALNHGTISEAISEAIAADVALAVAMVDVDGMKAVNDTYGHQAGDQVLLAVVQAITRPGAITGRYGGDEFLVALLNADRIEAEAYRDAVGAALQGAGVVDPESGARVPVVASVGIAMYPEDADTLKALIERADERMYEEKKARKANGTGLSPSRTIGDERAARMVGELVPLLTSSGTLDEKLRLVAHRLSVGAGYAGVNFDVLGEHDGRTTTVNQNAFTKAPDEVIEAWNRHQRSGVNGRISDLLRQTRRAVIIDDIAASQLVTEEQKKLLLSIGIVSGIVVPLFDGDAMVATMSVGSKDVSGFSQSDMQFLTAVAGQVSAIIRMARLVEDLRRATGRLEEARDETVMFLAEAAEAHTQSGGRHFLATRAIAEAIATEMGFDEASVRELGQAAALHDIGKIHLPDALLSSPEPLSPRLGIDPAGQAWETLQQHCARGREFLARGKGFELAAMAAYMHHERWDGAGYPQGIAGDAIPIEASIIAVADSLDAMMTESPYQPGRSLDEAVAEILACRGTQFRPDVVDALSRLYERRALHGVWAQDEGAEAA